MAKDRIDEKLTALCSALEEFKGISDRTKAIEDLAKSLSEVGEEQLSGAESRLAKLCEDVVKSVKAADDIPKKIEEAAIALDQRAQEGIDSLGKAGSMISDSVAKAARQIDASVRGFKSEAESAGEVFKKMLSDAVGSGPLADVAKLGQRLSAIEDGIKSAKDSIAKVKSVQDELVEAEKIRATADDDLRAMISELKEMVAKIPTKRGFFG